MLSRISKMSVFGIVALMLAFGLATTDALAAPGTATVGVSVDTDQTDNSLRAASEATLTFTVTVTAAPTNGDKRADTIYIAIPNGFSDPIYSENQGDSPANDVREVHIDNRKALNAVVGDTEALGYISGRRLAVDVGKDAASGAVVFTFKTVTPPRKDLVDAYKFYLTASVHTLTEGTTGTAGSGTTAVAWGEQGGRKYYKFPVRAVKSGSGTVTLTRTSGALHRQPFPDSGPPPHARRYLLMSEESLADLRITFTMAGSTPAHSRFTVTMTADDSANEVKWALSRRDQVVVTSPVTMDVTYDETNGRFVHATINKDQRDLRVGEMISITLKGLKAPKIVDATPSAINTGWSIKAESAIDPNDDNNKDTETREGTAVLVNEPDGQFNKRGTTNGQSDDQFDFVTTRPHGRGTLTLHGGAASTDPALVHLRTGKPVDPNPGNILIRLSNMVGAGGGSKYALELPAGWPGTYTPIGTARDQGALTGAGLSGDVGTSAGGNNDVVSDAAVEATYFLKEAPAPNAYTFRAKTSSGPHAGGTLTYIGDYTIHVSVNHGSGTMALTRNGQPFRQTTSEAEVGNLVFTYTPAGYMSSEAQVKVDLPDNWTRMRADDGNTEIIAGEVTVAPAAKAILTVDSDGGGFLVDAKEAWRSTDRIVITYKKVKVAKVDGTASHTFATQSQSFGAPDGTTGLGANLANLASSPVVGIGRAADGSGTLALDKTEGDAGSDLGTIAITYTAEGRMEAGSRVKIKLPDTGNWPKFNDDVESPGSVELAFPASAVLDVSDDEVTATTSTTLNNGEKITFNYKNVTAPPEGGRYTFNAEATSSYDGELTPLSAGGATIEIKEVAPGSVMLTNADGRVSSADPLEELGNLTFTFTAGAPMAAGSQVSINFDAAWDSPFKGNNAQDSRESAVWAGGAEFEIAQNDDGSSTVTVTTAAMNTGSTLVITYMMAQAPAAEDTYTFRTMSSNISGADLRPVRNHPQVVVRYPVTAVRLVVDNDNVFIGETINITVDLWDDDADNPEGLALGNLMINLSDGEGGGTFMNAAGEAVTSITIGDAQHSMSATYSNDSADEYTLTATAVGLDDVDPATAMVTVKSGITAKSADPDPASAGSDITISATGEADASAQLQLSYVNADDNTVTITKGLDPVGDPVDGSQDYSRTITLPADIPEGMHMVTLTIADRSDTVSFEVVNDQTPPTVSNAEVSKSVLMDGDTFTIFANVAMNESMVEIKSVTADLGGLDTTQEMVTLDEVPSSPGTYFKIVTIADDDANEAADGEYTITITATDDFDNASDPAMVMVSLANDPSTLDSVTVPPDVFRPGEMVTIMASGTAGQSAKFTVTSSDGTEMPSGQEMTEEPADSGMYMGTFMVVADVHTEGMYDVTVTMNDNPAKSISKAGSLNIGPAGYEFTLMIPKGTHAIHVPLAVNMINGEEGTIETVGDLYDALGDAVNFIISFIDGTPVSYLGDESAGSMADAAIGDDTGLIAVMKDAATLALVGDALGTGGVSQISVAVGNNLVGVPLDPAVDMMISDALVPGVEAIAFSNAAGDGFDSITPTDTSADGPIMGGVGYIVVASTAGSIPVVGTAWENDGAMMAAPAVAFSGSQTPVLHVNGGLLDEFDMMSRIPELRVTVKNLSTGASLDTVLGTELSETAYSGTFVEFSRHAAKAGDVLEITAHSPSPFVGVRPVPQIVVSAEEVLTSRISLPDLELYEIPSETELLANYPNPFNPETWIPYRLAKAAKVSLEIYDTNGSLVRSIDVGFKPAAVYESRASAIYWDGRNNYGERVASGTYFYHLTAGEDYASTRRMVILK